MAIFKKDKQISAVYYGSKAISVIYHGGKVIWEAITSCFGKGSWFNAYPWSNEDGWKNNN